MYLCHSATWHDQPFGLGRHVMESEPEFFRRYQLLELASYYMIVLSILSVSLKLNLSLLATVGDYVCSTAHWQLNHLLPIKGCRPMKGITVLAAVISSVA